MKASFSLRKRKTLLLKKPALCSYLILVWSMAQQGINMTNSKQMGGSFSKAEKRKQKRHEKCALDFFTIWSDVWTPVRILQHEGWWLLNWPHPNLRGEILCQSPDLEEKIICENKTAKVQRSVFLAPVDVASLPCREAGLLVGRRIFKGPSWTVKMNCTSLREAATSLSKDEWKKIPVPTAEISKPPHPSQGDSQKLTLATDQARNMLASCQSTEPF